MVALPFATELKPRQLLDRSRLGVRILMMRVRQIRLQLSGENSPPTRFALAWEKKSATGPLIGTEISDRSRGSWWSVPRAVVLAASMCRSDFSRIGQG